MSKVLVIDPIKCRGCLSCVIACATRNEGECNINMSRIKVASIPAKALFFPLACLQCEIPYCALVCPVGALNKNNDTGVVEQNRDKCIGCKLCLLACPFGNVIFVNGVAAKCDLCGGDPTCVKVCEPGALSIGEADEIGTGRKAIIVNKFFDSLSDTITGTAEVKAGTKAEVKL